MESAKQSNSSNGLYYFGAAGFSLIIALLIAYTGLVTGALLTLLMPALFFIALVFKFPTIGLKAYFVASFTAIGLTRYLPGPLGLVVDALLVFTWLVLILQKYPNIKQHIWNPLVMLMFIWFGYLVFQIINPEARSKAAWFYAMRGLGLYFALGIPLVFVLFPKQKHLYTFLKMYIGFCVATALWGYKQRFIGIDAAEQAWLNAGAATTHVLFGKLRVFSFLSDAGQFGGVMAHATVTAAVIALGNPKFSGKLIYGALAAFFFVALAISGSRGPVVMVFAGFGMYLLLIQNFRLILLGAIVGGGLFGLLNFTSVGSNIAEVQRIRSAFNPNDPSLLVRLENQRKLKAYLANKPFGGGVGSGGEWGQRFTPGTFLAETPYDSWYVKVWVETGIIGLIIHLSSILIILTVGYIRIVRVKNEYTRVILSALFASYFAAAVGSYGNQLYGQMPMNTIIIFSTAFFFMAANYNQEESNTHELNLAKS